MKIGNRAKETLKGQDRSEQELSYEEQRERYISQTPFSPGDVVNNFTKYITRQALSRFLCKQELFRKIIDVDGSVVECGVFQGGGVMTWAQLSAIYEPSNYTRKIFGFDTFKGFSELSGKDAKSKSVHAHAGGLASDSFADITEAARLYDMNRSIGHVPKVELIQGDACTTIPAFLAENNHLVVSLLYLDFDVYEPTMTALKTFLPRMPRGAVLAFDELNSPHWPGETLAVAEACGIIVPCKLDYT